MPTIFGFWITEKTVSKETQNEKVNNLFYHNPIILRNVYSCIKYSNWYLFIIFVQHFVLKQLPQMSSMIDKEMLPSTTTAENEQELPSTFSQSISNEPPLCQREITVHEEQQSSDNKVMILNANKL